MKSDTELMDYLAAHPTCVRPGRDRYGKPAWEWSINGKQYAAAYTLRSAIMAALVAAQEELAHVG